jgi:hypothetical protein
VLRVDGGSLMLGDRVGGLSRHPGKGFGTPSMAGVRVLCLDSMVVAGSGEGTPWWRTVAASCLEARELTATTPQLRTAKPQRADARLEGHSARQPQHRTVTRPYGLSSQIGVADLDNRATWVGDRSRLGTRGLHENGALFRRRRFRFVAW